MNTTAQVEDAMITLNDIETLIEEEIKNIMLENHSIVVKKDLENRLLLMKVFKYYCIYFTYYFVFVVFYTKLYFDYVFYFKRSCLSITLFDFLQINT